MPGPPPTPTPILSSRGSWRAKERVKAGEPSVPVKRPAPPPHLKGESRAEWNRMVKELAAFGCVARIDRAMLATYCEAWAEYVAAGAFIEKHGGPLECDDAVAVQVGRAGRIRRAHREYLLKVAKEFGATPAARSRLRAVGAESQSSRGPDLADFKIA